MLRLFKSKDNKEDDKQKVNSGMLRLKKDKESLDIPDNTDIVFDDKKESELKIIIKPNSDSLWHGAQYTFKVEVSPNYPIDPPKMVLQQPIFHPNIDQDGKICLNILREDWKPVFNLNTLVIGLNSLFDSPNPNDPLNQKAGQIMRENPNEFNVIVRRTLHGIHYAGRTYPSFI